MVYKVIITDQAQQDFLNILDYPHPKFSPLERVAYVEALQARCFSLDFMPQRFRQMRIGGNDYHVLPFKSHLVIYSVDEPSRTTSIITIRASAMRPKAD